MTTNVFCLLNCFNNYEIIAGNIIKYYIQNGVKALLPSSIVNVNTFLDTTPYLVYTMSMLSMETVLGPATTTSKQYQDYIMILGMAAVTLARIWNSDIIIMSRQDVTILPGFASLYTIANMLNKKVIYWTDDMRNLWGTTDDPLFIGVAQLPYRYLWGATPNPTQDPSYNNQPNNLNGSGMPLLILGSDTNACPTSKDCNVKKCWNTFAQMILQCQSIQQQNTASTLDKHTQNLITLGNAIINFVEQTKDIKNGKGWKPGYIDNKVVCNGGNCTLWYDIEYVINENIGLLYKEEQEFIMNNKIKWTNDMKENILTMITNSTSTNDSHKKPYAYMTKNISKTSIILNNMSKMITSRRLSGPFDIGMFISK